MSKNVLVVVDVESDGPVPGSDMFSMVCFGAVVVNPKLDLTFYGETAPISKRWDPEALAISGFSREQHLDFEPPERDMKEFGRWIKDISPKGGRAILISDNLAYDWQFINYYFHRFEGSNPFGFSGRRIGDLFAGLERDLATSWKKYRITDHDHNPVNDAKGNAEALLKLAEFGVRNVY